MMLIPISFRNVTMSLPLATIPWTPKKTNFCQGNVFTFVLCVAFNFDVMFRTLNYVGAIRIHCHCLLDKAKSGAPLPSRQEMARAHIHRRDKKSETKTKRNCHIHGRLARNRVLYLFTSTNKQTTSTSTHTQHNTGTEQRKKKGKQMCVCVLRVRMEKIIFWGGMRLGMGVLVHRTLNDKIECLCVFVFHSAMASFCVSFARRCNVKIYFPHKYYIRLLLFILWSPVLVPILRCVRNVLKFYVHNVLVHDIVCTVARCVCVCCVEWVYIGTSLQIRHHVYLCVIYLEIVFLLFLLFALPNETARIEFKAKSRKIKWSEYSAGELGLLLLQYDFDNWNFP